MRRSLHELRASLRESKTRYDHLQTERDNAVARNVDNPVDAGHAEFLRRTDAAIAKVDTERNEIEAAMGREAQAAELDERHAFIRRVAENPANCESGAEFGEGHPRTGTNRQTGNAARDEALRTIESHSGELRSDAADRLERVVRTADPMGLEARYLSAVGDPAYNPAFGKMLQDPNHGHLRFSPEEVQAVRRTSAIEAERGLVTGVGSQGGFAIPFTLDPSVMLTSDAALNPIRHVARVITISTHDWKGVSSAGVTAAYQPEAAEVADNTPVLAQPSIVTAMGRAFIPFSIEAGEDWAGLQGEMLKLISDGRDGLDATKFLSGSGTNEPAGVLTGLAVAQRVLTNTIATFALGDTYLLKQALAARFMARASFAAHPNVYDAIYRFVGGNSTEPAPLPTREGPLLGQPKTEWSTMSTATTTTGAKIALYGDFAAGFTIADRIGMTAEIVPHLMGINRRPTGERGIFAYWRTGSKVVVPEALRYLEVK